MCRGGGGDSSRRSNRDNIFKSHAAIKHTSSGLIPGIRSIYTAVPEKAVAPECKNIGTPVFGTYHGGGDFFSGAPHFGAALDPEPKN